VGSVTISATGDDAVSVDERGGAVALRVSDGEGPEDFSAFDFVAID